jgi:ABC-type nitrate/sulfonate/bicarbonate transport system permease component
MGIKEDTKLSLWRLLLIVGGLGLVEASVRAGWIDPFSLASPLQAIAVLCGELCARNL